MRCLRWLGIALLCWLLPAAAIEVVEGLDSAQEARYRALAEELRCLVCQNQSLSDSNADLARDMRAVVRDMIQAGADDKEIIGFMTERYGDFVLYRPPLKPSTVLLWVLPFVILLGGLGIAIMRWRGAQRPAQLSQTQREEARDILGE